MTANIVYCHFPPVDGGGPRPYVVDSKVSFVAEGADLLHGGSLSTDLGDLPKVPIAVLKIQSHAKPFRAATSLPSVRGV